MSDYVLDLEAIARTQLPVAGGKGAHLGELSRIEGIHVPAGFCVTTTAFERLLSDLSPSHDGFARLSRLSPAPGDEIATIAASIRQAIEDHPVPDDVAAAIASALTRFGERAAYAVRSSATAEDLPAASFAGQQDSCLNVVGSDAIVRSVRRCWASLYTERAVVYRMRAGLDHRKVRMAVVVQRMVFPQASGILFTADPLTGNRKVASVEAGFGLGEALVSGRVNPDVYTVRDGRIVEKQIRTKPTMSVAVNDGGIHDLEIAPERRDAPALTDAEVVELEGIGRRIEAHFGRPQDIEWCLADDGFWIVQSRPITTLFPVPAAGDGRNRVYVSVGHQQMMTDPMSPLGLSIWQRSAGRPMVEAGGRLFVDVTDALATAAGREGLVTLTRRSDPLVGDALQMLLDRGDVIGPPAGDGPSAGPRPAGAPPADPIEPGSAIVEELIARTHRSVDALARDIRSKSGIDLLEFIAGDLQELKRILFDPRSHQVVTGGMQAAWWLGDRLNEWLGEKSVVDTLSRSVPHNVTSEMGLALLDVADAIRPHPEVVAFLRHTASEVFLDELPRIPGGQAARDAIDGWLERYGMRGVGEIDISRPRWRERPLALVPILLGHVDRFEPGEARRRFEEGRQAAQTKAREVLERLRALPDGERKAEEAGRMIDRLRAFIGYREFPKFGMICRYFIYKQALLRESARLVERGVFREADDLFYLRFEELQEAVGTGRADDGLIGERREALRWHATLRPPRVLTSDGEMLNGAYRRGDLPADALAGLPVCAGTVEGRARVVREVADARLEAGDILVTTCTDPSWAPLFVACAGLVTEVGGLMTHGAVIAREYGLPAVVGVHRATTLIRDGQQIRVNGTEGYVQILD